ncbi:OmpA family protein [Salinisphaera sp. USBA-960]|uniref:OmpA family protein n=1 Tax=Salinisphaera orenii TaxID=856731 RepID=UPI0013A5F7EF|nr:OmpA family protein [Salifodinibacter halophilus]NNC25446.1 OmpA family protein [Salifodinibacter halophilus]
MAEDSAHNAAAGDHTDATTTGQAASQSQETDQSKLDWRPVATDQLVNQGYRKIKKYPVIIRPVVQVGGLRGNLSATRTLDGQLETRTYRLSKKADANKVAAAYRQRLKQNGYRVIFHCSGEECGPHFPQVSPGDRHAGQYFGGQTQAPHYLVADKAESAFDRYIVLQIGAAESGKQYALVGRIKTKPMPIAAIQVSAKQMAQSIKNKGRVALYGIYFATDSAQLEPKSKPTLEQIAKLLHNQPKLDLMVVGHTDSSGKFQYNIKLSRQRARAVTDALVEDHGVDRDRLKTWGDGYTAPQATNRSAAGRKRNRRVELVPQ